jgi:hypothetical protein
MAETEQYDDKPEGDKKEKSARSDYVRYWLDSIDAVEKSDKDWRKDGDGAVRVYRGDKEADDVFARSREFNIFHSNIETTLPAIYNSTPAPDVRRRFGDKDKVAKTVSQIVERCLSYSVDSYEFDELMRQVLFDGLVPGRGVARVRYVPYFVEVEKGEQAEVEPTEGVENDPQPEKGEALAYEEVRCEYVPWKRFRIGPADEWGMVPWIAFEHFLTRKEIEKLSSKEIAENINLDCRVDGSPAGKDDGIKSDTLKRGRVWEIWDKEEKKVIFLAPGYPDDTLYEEDDPLGLENFFPVPRPIQPIMTPGNMTPVCPYRVYQTLVEELNEITGRIKKLVRQIRVRGGYAGGSGDLQNILEADDGELVPLQGMEQWIDNGGLDKAITWWPIEPTVKALAQLYEQREVVKQTIYEVTGISDIVRGASKASETATAQQIKNQWGSLRIQKMQGEVARFARDLFRLKAAIIAKRFAPQTVMMISGVNLLPQAQKQAFQQQAMMGHNGGPPMEGQPAPQPIQLPEEVMRAMEEPSIEEVFGVLQSDMLRSYRIDIESDSTIRADLTRNQQAMNEFLQGTAQYIAAVGPAVQSGQMPPQAAVEVYTAFARNYKLGKQAEDALEKMSEGASKPQPQKPDPEAEKAKAQIQLEQQKAQIQQQNDQSKLALEQRKMEMQAANDQAKMQNEMAMAQQKMRFEMELEREKAAQQYEIEMMKANADIEIKRQQAQEQAQLNAAMSANKMTIAADEAKAKAKMQRQQATQ